MNTIRNKILVIFIFAAFAAKAAPVSNSTEHLSLNIDDVSINIFTLTLLADNFRIKEKVEKPRDVLNIGKLKISLELARSLLLWRFQIDCFLLENVYLNILEDKEGNDFLFDKRIPESEINKLMGSAGKTNEQKKAEIDLSIPFLEIKNVNIVCNDYDTRKFLWSLDHLNLFIYDFMYPPEKNNDLWSIFLSAKLNGETNSALLFSAKCRTVPENSFLKLKIKANKIDYKTFDMIFDTGKKVAKRPETQKVKGAFSEESSPVTALTDCFSNEINRITAAFDKKVLLEKSSGAASNFFGNTSISNLVFYFNWEMEISNHIFKNGNIQLKMLNAETNLPPLDYRYQITNSAELLIKMKP